MDTLINALINAILLNLLLEADYGVLKLYFCVKV